jgi:hypothetical protein
MIKHHPSILQIKTKLHSLNQMDPIPYIVNGHFEKKNLLF